MIVSGLEVDMLEWARSVDSFGYLLFTLSLQLLLISKVSWRVILHKTDGRYFIGITPRQSDLGKPHDP